MPQDSEMDCCGGLTKAASELGCGKDRISTGTEKAGTGVRKEQHLELQQITEGNGHIFRLSINRPIKDYQQSKS